MKDLVGHAYRPDLDGLRAVAVLSVILFHMDKTSLSGGYLGVDVFFVLSGFLITTIIRRDLLSGEFSLIEFYKKRVRRIAPALFFSLFIVSIGSVLLILPSDISGVGRSMLASIGMVANFYFWRDSGYFSKAAEEKPLLHTWSLSVEEQFYLFFPLFLIFLASCQWRRSISIILLLGIFSFSFNMILLRAGGGTAAFFFPMCRVWEFSIGALIACFPYKRARSRKLTEVISILGFFLMMSGIFGHHMWLSRFHIPVPVGVALGTGLIIFSGGRGKCMVSRMLSINVVVFLGLISYSLYLLHWPLIVFLKYYLVREMNGIELIVILTVALALSCFSWRFIEIPFRNKSFSWRYVSFFLILAIGLISAISFAFILKGKFFTHQSSEVIEVNASVNTHYRCPVAKFINLGDALGCALQLDTRDPSDADILLIGNSHAQMYAPLIGEIAKKEGLNALLIPMTGCTPTARINISPGCAKLAELNLATAETISRARLILIATTWDLGTGGSAEQFLADLDDTVQRFSSMGKRVALVGPIAIPGWDVASIVSRKMAFGHPIERRLYMERGAFLKNHSKILAHFEGRRDIEFIRPDHVQCTDLRCAYIDGARSLFADSNHLSALELHRFHDIFYDALMK